MTRSNQTSLPANQTTTANQPDVGSRVQDRLCGGEETGKDEPRGRGIPLRGISAIAAATAPSEDPGDGDRGIREEQQRLHRGGKLQERERRHVAAGDADETCGDAEIPEERADDDPVEGAEQVAAEAIASPAFAAQP